MQGPEDNTPARRPDPTQLRISDNDRHKVAEILREAAGDGRIDLEELDERLEATYAAKTYADLVPITLDLPSTGPGNPATSPVRRAESQIVPGGPTHQSGLAIMSGIERKGVWVVPEHYTVTCLMGGAELDLRQARFAAKEVVLTVNAFMGGAEVTVNPYTQVIMEGIGIMGGYSAPDDDVDVVLDDSSPVVRIRGVAIMGGVDVRRRPMPGQGPPRRLRR